MFIDYYKILETATSASPDAIRKAYREQAKKWHPDKHPGIDTTSRMQDINEAYLILNDPEARERYGREYEKYLLFKNQSARPVVNDKEKPGEQKVYEVKDDILEKWMENARRQAVSLAKQMIEELRGMTTAGFKAASKGAKKVLMIQLFWSIVLILFFGMLALCKNQ